MIPIRLKPQPLAHERPGFCSFKVTLLNFFSDGALEFITFFLYDKSRKISTIAKKTGVLLMYTYTWYQWLAFFYIYCVFGWIFESTYVSLKTGRFVNRGFLRIPMLPLYGSGAVMMLWVSLPVKDNLFLVYLSGVIAATALEYVTGSVMEQLFKIRYWDYSNQRFQIKGYICLSSSLAWGFLTILMTEVIQRPISKAVQALSPNALVISVLLITAVFVTDAYESTKAALALGKSLEALTKLKADMDELQGRITALKEEAAEQVSALCIGAEGRLAHAKWEALEKMDAARKRAAKRLAAATARPAAEQERLLRQLEEIKEKKRALLSRGRLHQFYQKGLLRGNPGAISSKFEMALKELKEQIEKYNKS